MRAIPPYILSMRIADLAYRIDFARACLPGREAVTVGEIYAGIYWQPDRRRCILRPARRGELRRRRSLSSSTSLQRGRIIPMPRTPPSKPGDDRVVELNITLDRETAAGLRRAAMDRSINTTRLAQTIVSTTVNAGLIDAVLDDDLPAPKPR